MERQIRVLLVDDQQDILNSFSTWLEAEGYSVICANSGEEAIKIIEAKAPDIVFLDIKMMRMEGNEVLPVIKQIRKELPVIMISSFSDKETVDNAMKLGASGFFSKLDGLEELRGLIDVTLYKLKLNSKRGRKGNKSPEPRT